MRANLCELFTCQRHYYANWEAFRKKTTSFELWGLRSILQLNNNTRKTTEISSAVIIPCVSRQDAEGQTTVSEKIQSTARITETMTSRRHISHAHAHAHTPTHTRINTHTHTHTCINTHTHTHTHSHTKINADLLNFLLICESWKIKCITVSTKILCSTTVFNIDNNQKCFLSSILLWFLKIMWLWRLQ